MAAFKVDGTFTTAAVQGGPHRTFPFERDTTAFIEEQRYIQLKANFERLALNTAHPTIPTAYLVQETDLQNVGAGLVEWTRRYATVPATRIEYQADPYVFPAVFDAIGSDSWRIAPLAMSVTHRVEYSYYLVGSATYPTVDDIPLVLKFAPLFSVSIPVEVDFVNPSTVPTASAYLDLVDDAEELAVEDSDLHIWLGNIYERVTRYVKAR